MQHDRREWIAEFVRDTGRETAQEGKMRRPLGGAFQALARGPFLLEPRLGLRAGGDVLHREQNELHMIEAARVQQDRARANPLKVMVYFIVVEDRLLR